MKFQELWSDWVMENGSYKVVALFITLILWVSVLGRKETTLTREIPVAFSIGADRTITETSARSVRFELSGSRRALRKMARDKVEPITVDLSAGSTGRVIVTVPDDSLKLPFGVKVVSANPSTLAVDIEPVVKKKVPVIVVWRDRDEKDAVMRTAKIIPSEVFIEGGKSSVKRVREVLTQEVSRQDAILEGSKHVIRTKLRGLDHEGLKSVEDQDVVIEF